MDLGVARLVDLGNGATAKDGKAVPRLSKDLTTNFQVLAWVAELVCTTL